MKYKQNPDGTMIREGALQVLVPENEEDKKSIRYQNYLWFCSHIASSEPGTTARHKILELFLSHLTSHS